jgi:hypothetical protein
MTAAMAAAVMLYLRNPAGSHFYPPCPFHLLTGLYCPGCGSLRAIHQLLHGRLVAAFGLNPLMLVLLPFVLYGLAVRFVRSVTGRRLPDIELSQRGIWILLGVIIAYWILRNLPVYPFTLFAP